jgi:phosphoglycolate phosphatase
MPQLLALIFDLDGTLVDSAADLRQAVNAILVAHGRRPVSIAEVKKMVGDGLQTMMQRAFVATGEPITPQMEATVFQDFLSAYQNQQASPDQLYPQVRETLTAFRLRNIKIGLCTNKLYQPTLRLLDDIGITGLFDFVAGCDTFSVYKPDPGHVLGVARGLKTPTQNCAMIGDSANDIRAAKGAGVASIAVSHGYGDASALGADAVIAGFIELPAALRSLGFDFVG